jgi:CDP-glucose 4,6-dehydratase
MNLSFWRGRRVFVTGHTGFKGSWLCLWLQSMGAQVTGYALAPPTSPSLFDLARVADGMQASILADIRDAATLEKSMHEAQPEVVIHMAAQPLVRLSYEQPVETYATNVMGTVHLLEAVRKTPSVRAVVNVTTDKCYENREWVWGYRENEPMGGHDPYSSSKGCAELVTSAYRASFFPSEKYAQHQVGLASARAGNVIGGGDWAADRLIPDILAALIAGREIQIRNPSAIRPWQHVLEPLRGYLMLAERLVQDGPAFAQAWNFGPALEDARPVQWIVEDLLQKWGEDGKWSLQEGQHPHEAHFLKLDIAKVGKYLSWFPVLDLNVTLQWIVDWLRSYVHDGEVRSATLRQISTYQSLLLKAS